MNIKYFMLTTDSGNNEDYNIFYCPIYRVTGEGDFSEPVFAKTNDNSEVWIEAVEDLGYEVEEVELNFVIQTYDDDDEVEDESWLSPQPVDTVKISEVLKRIAGG